MNVNLARMHLRGEKSTACENGQGQWALLAQLVRSLQPSCPARRAGPLFSLPDMAQQPAGIREGGCEQDGIEQVEHAAKTG